MDIHKIFAIILGGEIKNIIVCDSYELANQIARLNCGAEAFAVDCMQCPCSIGDAYKDGIFYNKESGKEVERIPTDAEKISMLEAEKEKLELRQAETELEIDYRLAALELGLI